MAFTATNQWNGSTYVTTLSNRAVLCGRCDDSRPSRWPTHWSLGIIDSIDAGRGLFVGSLDTFSVLDLEVLPVFFKQFYSEVFTVPG